MELTSEVLGFAIQDPMCQTTCKKGVKSVESAAKFVVATAKTVLSESTTMQRLSAVERKLGQLIQYLLDILELPVVKQADQCDDFVTACQQIVQCMATVIALERKAQYIKEHKAMIKSAVRKVASTSKEIILANTDAWTIEVRLEISEPKLK